MRGWKKAEDAWKRLIAVLLVSVLILQSPLSYLSTAAAEPNAEAEAAAVASDETQPETKESAIQPEAEQGKETEQTQSTETEPPQATETPAATETESVQTTETPAATETEPAQTTETSAAAETEPAQATEAVSTEAETETETETQETETAAEKETETESEKHTASEITNDMRQLRLALGSPWYLSENEEKYALAEAEGALDYRAVPQERLQADKGMTAGFTVQYRLLENGEDRDVHAGDWFIIRLPECLRNIRLTENGQECRGGAGDALIDGVNISISNDSRTMKVTFGKAIDKENMTGVHGRIGLTFDISEEQLAEETVCTLSLQQSGDGLNQYALYLPKEQQTESETETEQEIRLFSMRKKSAAQTGTEIQETVEKVLKVHWNDNNESGKRPDPEKFKEKVGVEVTAFLDGEKLTDKELEELGITLNLSIASSINDKTVATWDYTVGGLPKYVTVDGEQKELTYESSIKVPEFVDNYVPVKIAGCEATYTLQTEYTAKKLWYDEGAVDDNGKNQARPAMDEFAKKLHLYRHMSNANANTAAPVESEGVIRIDGEGTITLDTSNLPAYDDNGNPYVYFIKEDTDKLSKDSEVGTYKAEYINYGNYAGDTARLYNDGELINTLKNETTFTVEKVWKDGESNERPKATLYLYRYAEGDGSYDSASPVHGFDFMEVPEEGGAIEFVSADSAQKLPMYDQHGRKYVYFAIERGLTGDYVSEITRDGKVQEDSKHILNGDMITNRLKKDVEIKAKKTFIAAAMQGFKDTGVTLQLQRRYADPSKGGEWQAVMTDEGDPVTLTLKGFSANTMSVEGGFGTFPMYDKDGYKYEYRYIETGVTVQGETEQIETDSYDEAADGVVTTVTIPGLVGPGVGDDGTTAKFQVEMAEDGSIINRLVGKTQVLAKKVWSGGGGDGESGSELPEGAKVTIRLHREDGKSSISKDGAVSDALTDADGNLVYDIVLNGNEEEAWQAYFTNLVRYDENGHEYTYTIEEVADESELKGYSFDRVEYKKVTNLDRSNPDERVTELQATVFNVKGPGERLIFDLEKVWVDESDLLHRNSVLMGIYEKGTNKLVGEAILSEANNWKKRVGIAREDGKTVDDYYVREISINENGSSQMVTYLADTNGATEDLYTDKQAIVEGNAPIAGEVTTDEHLYHVYLQKNKVSDSQAEYTAYNQRYGFLTLHLIKNWIADGVEVQDLPTATFTLTQKDKDGNEKTLTFNNEEDKSFTLTAESKEGKKPQASWNSDGQVNGMDKLPKYDSQGRLYSYELKEIKIGNQAIDGGLAEVGGDTYVSSVSYDRTDYGTSQHTDDHIYWSATNTRQETGNLTVNKIWGDDGSATSRRPDVVFSVYRTSAYTVEQILGETGLDDTKIETVAADRIWNTKHNDWWWSCDLGALERYDGNGKPYVYFLEETVRANPENYQAYYYNGTVKPAKGTVTSSKEVFAPNPADNPKDFGSRLILQDGTGTEYSKTVVNTRSTNRYIEGKKIWTHLPNAFEKEYLPDVDLIIYRSLDAKLTENAEQVASVKAERKNNFTFSYGKKEDGTYSLPKYDQYGRTYHYFVKEKPGIAGYQEYSREANQFIVENIYNPNTVPVEITVSKSWTGLQEGDKIPDITFELWRKLQDSNGNEIGGTEKKVSEQKLTGGTYSLSESEQYSVTFTEAGANGVDANDELPYYAPNGQPYIYCVKEVVPKGYEAKTGDDINEQTVEHGTGDNTCVSSDITLTKSETAGKTTYTGTVSYTNRYHGESEESLVNISVEKNWQDQNDRFSTRPESITVTLYRKTATSEEGKEVSGASETLSKDNKWSCTFENLERYATSGEEYIYYVEESAVDGQSTKLNSYQKGDGAGNSVTVTANGNPLIKVTNRLETTNVTAKKVVKGQLGDGSSARLIDLTGEQLKLLFDMGAVTTGTTFTFTLQKKVGDGWETVRIKDGEEAEWSQSVVVNNADDLAALQNKTFSFANLPKYEEGYSSTLTNAAQHRVSYRVVEIVKKDNVDVATFKVTYNNQENDAIGVKEGNYTITNTIPVREVQIDKIWDDDYNRDDTRPGSITVTLIRDSNQKHTFTLTKSTTPGQSNDVNTWTTGIWYVPLYKSGVEGEYSTYAAVEQDTIENYTNITPNSQDENWVYPKHTANDPLKSDATNYNWFAFKNQYNSDIPRATVDISVSKDWDGIGEADDPYRPDQVYFTLQVWNPNTEKFETATAENCGLSGNATQTVTEDGNWQPVKWGGLWKYHEQTTANPTGMLYRIVETDKEGNEITGNYPYEWEAVDINTLAKVEPAGKITNTLKTVGAEAKKIWKKSASNTELTAAEFASLQEAGALPEKIRFQLFYKENDDSEWTAMMNTDNITPLTTEVDVAYTQGGTVYTMPSEWKLPKYARVTTGSTTTYTEIQYLVKEVALKYKNAQAWVDVDYNPADATSSAADNLNGNSGSFTITNSPERAGENTPAQTTITNTIPLGSITVTKNWQDEDNRDGKRPQSITLQLKRDGENFGDPVTVTAGTDGNWSYIWDSLPVYKNGMTEEKSIYTVSETQVSDYDTPSYTYDNDGTATSASTGEDVTVTNKKTAMQRITIQAKKAWQDKEQFDYGVRDANEKVTLTLQYLAGVDAESKEVWRLVEKGDLDNSQYPDGNGVYTTSAVTQEVTKAEQAKWENLPVYRLVTDSAGKAVKEEVIYRVIETPVDGYQTTYSTDRIFSTEVLGKTDKTENVTVTNTLETTNLAIEKTWSGDAYATGAVRPSSVTMELMYKHGGEQWLEYGTYTLCDSSDAKHNWKATVKNLPVKDSQGYLYEYDVKEIKLTYTTSEGGKDVTVKEGQNSNKADAGTYAAEVTTAKSADGTWLAEAVNTLESTQFTVSKIWADNNNRDGRRPETITLQLKRDGEAFGGGVTVKAGADGSWSHTWENLPKYKNDRTALSIYTVEETSLNDDLGYQANVAYVQDAAQTSNVSATVTNTHTPETFTIQAEKHWLDVDTHGLHPTSVILKLQASVSTDGEQYSAYADVAEDTAKTYLLDTHEGSGAYTTSAVEQTISRGENDTEDVWTGAQWNDLPVYSNGHKIKYQVVEVNVPNSYQAEPSAEITGGANEKIIATVSNKLDKTATVVVEKQWQGIADDIEKHFSLLPNAVNVQLEYSADGKVWKKVETAAGKAVLTKENGWKAVFGDSKNPLRNDYQYRVVEVSMVYGGETIPVAYNEATEIGGTVGGFTYTSATDYNQETQTYKTTLTNTLQTTQVAMSKTWEKDTYRTGEVRPSSVKMELMYKHGNTEWASYGTYDLSESNNWSQTVGGLPVKDCKGNEYKYYVKETEFTYTASEGSARKVTVSGTYGENGIWTADAGTYTAKVTMTKSADGAIWTAEAVNTLESIDFTASKVWADNEDRDGKRPQSITLQLKRDGKTFSGEVAVTVGTDGRWSYTWENLPKYNNDGTARSIYTVEETPLNDDLGYRANVAYVQDAAQTSNVSATVTNTHTPETFTIQAEKHWLDADTHGMHPTSVTLKLQASVSEDGERYSAYADVVQDTAKEYLTDKNNGSGAYTTSAVEQTISRGENDTEDVWTGAQWENLPVYSNGHKIRYQVVEVGVPDSYRTEGSTVLTGTKDKTEQAQVTNKQKGVVTAEVTKVFSGIAEGIGEHFSLMPEAVNVQLEYSADGSTWSKVETAAGRAVLTEENGWTAYFGSNDNPLRNDYQYRVVEVSMVYSGETIPVACEAGEEAAGTIGGFVYTSDTDYDASEEIYKTTITNTLQTTQVAMSKRWEGDTYETGAVRPSSVMMELLYKHGSTDWESYGTYELNDSNEWSGTVSGLPVKDSSGNAYEYYVKEVTLTYETPDGSTETVEAGEDVYANGIWSADAGTYTAEVKTEQHADGTWTAEAVNTLESTQFTVSKIWADNNNRDGKRPESITLQLLRDGEKFGQAVTVKAGADGSWSYIWEKLPKYRNDGEELSVYTVEEASPEISLYQADYTYAEKTEKDRIIYRGTVTNVHKPATFGILADKEWMNQETQGLRPTEVTLKLQASVSEDGVSYSAYTDVAQDTAKTYLSDTHEGSGAYTTSAVEQTISRGEGDTEDVWTGAQWDDLPVYSNGYKIKYKVVEVDVPESYVAEPSGEITGDAGIEKTAVVSNKLDGTVTAVVEKQWQGIAKGMEERFDLLPETVNVQLEYSADGKIWKEVETAAGKAALTKENGWKAVFGDSRNPLRNDYQYRVVEVSMVYGGETIPMAYEAEKTAGSIGSFTYTSDTAFDGESTAYRTVLTNTLKTAQITVRKEWDDQENRYATRPQADLAVKLQKRLAGSEEWEDVMSGTQGFTAELVYDSESGQWAEAEFGGMPLTDEKGQNWEYRAVEVTEVPGYTSSQKVSADRTVITNTLKTIEVSGSKTWIDHSNAYQTRPESVTLVISDQEKELQTQSEILWEKNGDVWAWSAKGLPKYLAGTDTEAVYRITELPVAGYEAEEASVTVEDGTADLVNQLIAVQFVKIAQETKQPLSGAKLMVRDLDGNMIESWTSSTQPHVIAGKLICGQQYELVEIAAPDGYEKAEDVIFTATAGELIQTITMEDAKVQKSQSGSISVTKFVTYGDSPLAVTMSYYAALFEDEKLTKRISNVKEIRMEDEYAKSIAFENLPDGIYYVAETDEYGNVVQEEPGLFTCEVIDGRCAVNESSPSGHAKIENKYTELPPGAHTFIKGRIEVEKQVTNGSEPISMEDETFYVALFMDVDREYRVSEVQELHMWNSSSAKTVFEDLSDGTYYLAETDENGTALTGTEADFHYTIEMPESVFVIGNQTAYSTHFCNVNKDLKVDEEKPGETEKTEEATEASKKPAASAAKTADDTDIMSWMMLMFAAAAALVAAKKARKRKML